MGKFCVNLDLATHDENRMQVASFTSILPNLQTAYPETGQHQPYITTEAKQLERDAVL